MTKEQLKKFRTALIRSCNAWIKAGYKLNTGTYDYCPIDILTRKVPDKSLSFPERLTRRLGFLVSEKDVYSFVCGFDGITGLDKRIGTIVNNAFLLGRELRKKYGIK